MPVSPLIALTTDFGQGSSYVAQMKGVLLSVLPSVRLVDVSHDLPAHSIRDAELLLRSTAFAFPVGTIHLVVVDPGVGTARRGIAVESRGMIFVGPDNGVLGGPLGQEQARAFHLNRAELFRQPISATFHGRDIFAPVAAELGAGLPISEVGDPISDAMRSTLPVAKFERGRRVGEILGADRFGNLFTNVPARGAVEVRVGDDVVPVFSTYGEAQGEGLFALEGSDGYIELARNSASAYTALDDAVGMDVVVTIEDGS